MCSSSAWRATLDDIIFGTIEYAVEPAQCPPVMQPAGQPDALADMLANL
jgi:hypothetical protein